MGIDQQDTENKVELRKWLAARLEVKDVSHALWQLLEDDHYVEEVLMETQKSKLKDRKDELLKRARRVLGFNRKHNRETDNLSEGFTPGGEGGGGGTPRPIWDTSHVFGLPPDHPVKQRGIAFSLYVAKLMDDDSKVKQFRQEVLGGHLISSEDKAVAFISSPATAIFSSKWFKDNGVPLGDHTARVLEQERPSPESPRQVRGILKVVWNGGELRSTFEGTALSEIPSWVKDISVDPAPVIEGSVLSDLHEVTNNVSTRFPWSPLLWDPIEVPMFVLMRKVPSIEPVRVAILWGVPYQYDTVNITVCPWVPVEDVASVYEGVRKLLNPTSIHSQRRLALYTFIMQQPEVRVFEWHEPELPSWRKLLRLWNEMHPEGSEWHYKDVRNFSRDFREAFDHIVNFYRPRDDGVTSVQTEDIDDLAHRILEYRARWKTNTATVLQPG